MSKMIGTAFSSLRRTLRGSRSEKIRLIGSEKNSRSKSPKPSEKKRLQILGLSQKIQTYLTHLFKYITPKYCFVSGAFVIQDNDLKLYNILKAYYKLTKRYPLFASHLKYSDRTKVVNSVNSYVKEVIFENGRVSVTCNSAVKSEGITRHFKMLKWYKFSNKSSVGKNTYIFMKPETSIGSNNTEHVGNLVGKKTTRPGIIAASLQQNESPRSPRSPVHATNKDYLLYRREDCDNPKYKRTAPCRYPFTTNPPPYEFYQNTRIELKGKSFSNAETYERGGDEIFIPNEVSDFLVDLIEQEKDFNVSVSGSVHNKTVTIRTIHTGGGTRKRRKH